MKKKASPMRRLGEILLWIPIGLAVAVFFPALGNLDTSLVAMVKFVAGFIAISYLVTFVHEGGHWLAGRLAGFRTVRFSVGPLTLHVVRDRLHFRFGFNRGLPAGATQMIFRNSNAMRARYMAFTAGGPVASLLTAGLAVVLAQPLAGGDLRTALFIYAWLSAFAGVINLLPVRFGAFASDGLQLLTLLRGGRDARHMIAGLHLVALLFSGVRPREWPSEIVAVLDEGEPSTALRNTTRALQFLYLCDREESEPARRILELELEALEQEASQLKANWHLDAALFYSRVDGDGEKARRHLAEGGPAIYVDDVVRHMIEAEVLLAERRVHEAAQAWRRAVNNQNSIVYLPAGIPFAEALDDLEQRLRAASIASDEDAALRKAV